MARVHGFFSGEVCLFEHLDSSDKRCYYNHLYMVVVCANMSTNFVSKMGGVYYTTRTRFS